MLAHVDQELDPLSYHHWGRLAAYHICRVLTAYLLFHQRGSYPFSYQSGHWGFRLLEALRRMVLDSAVDIHKQPNPEPVALGKCMLILFSISHPVILF
jgi:hypothetical protein